MMLVEVPNGYPRDIAKAKPVTNTVTCIFTDLKGPFTHNVIGQDGGAPTHTYGIHVADAERMLRVYLF